MVEQTSTPNFSSQISYTVIFILHSLLCCIMAVRNVWTTHAKKWLSRGKWISMANRIHLPGSRGRGYYCLTELSAQRQSLGWCRTVFCIKDNITAAVERNRPRWPAGEYCIYQKGSDCPDGLQSGWMFWDDEDGAGGTNKNAHAGILPKGVFNNNTKIFFCCKNTVNGYKEPIDLPFASPFYLMAFRPHCQEVLYTIHKTEYIAYDTEDDHNTDMKSFPYPYGADFSPPRIHYCYYRGNRLSYHQVLVCSN